MGTECCFMTSLMGLSFCFLSFFETENQNARAHFLENRFRDRIQPLTRMAVAWWERSGSNTSFKSGLPHWRLPLLLCVFVCLLVCLPSQWMDGAEEPHKECFICLALPSNCTVSTRTSSQVIFHGSWCFSTEGFGFNKSALSNGEVFCQRNSPNI